MTNPGTQLAKIRHGKRLTIAEGRRAIEALIARHGTQQRVADAIGVSRQTISNWLRGVTLAPAELGEHNGN